MISLMNAELIINVTPWETRVALLENGSVVEFHVERIAEREYVGNIYKGRVVRVLPGMQAAFVDINLDRTAFLYVSDVQKDSLDYEKIMLADYAVEKEAAFLDPETSQANDIKNIPFSKTSVIIF